MEQAFFIYVVFTICIIDPSLLEFFCFISVVDLLDNAGTNIQFYKKALSLNVSECQASV
ncbi:hypothetical protein VIBNISFn118_270003 [Vibrio nigripulchritudo SFn118]|nr:hypothetical protein VIBNISFn118_270003 [Vibrio nigripulchritudo SFn118]